MKRLSIVLLFTAIIWTVFLAPASAGDIGFSILYSDEDVITGSVFFGGLHLSYFQNGEGGAEKRQSGTSNYGKTKMGEVDNLEGFDIGYSWKIAQYLKLGVEGSVGFETHYSKYRDRRFTEGYYLDEEYSETVYGVGAIAIIPIHEDFWIVFSANSIKGISAGFSLSY